MSDFQLKIFKAIIKENIGKNVVVSPISIYHILSLTTNGAAKKTLEEMLKTLCHKDLDELNKNNSSIASAIEKFKSVEFANAVYTKVQPTESFTKMIKQYNAKIDVLKEVEVINKWCSDATHEKIPIIIDALKPNDVMVLINALYFKGVWKKSFDKNNTYENIFMNFNKEKVSVDFMDIEDKFDFYEDSNVQAISLRYKDDNMVATIILPKTEVDDFNDSVATDTNNKSVNDDINNYIDSLTLDTYNNIISKMRSSKVKLTLPKFEINYEDELSKSFMSLGMVEAFTDNADFSSMIKDIHVQIARIIHKTYIKIDEEGTEASAATAVVMTKRSIDFSTPSMMVNHPFLFIIRNEKLPHGNDIIFASKIEMIKK